MDFILFIIYNFYFGAAVPRGYPKRVIRASVFKCETRTLATYPATPKRRQNPVFGSVV